MWSDSYIGLQYKWGECDCLRLTEKILLNEKNFQIEEDGKPVSKEWYVQNPERLIKEAVKRGEVIKDIIQLREFDIVFFKIHDVIRHMGIMVDCYGRFVHQLEKQTSRLDDLNTNRWKKRFFCAIRLNFDDN